MWRKWAFAQETGAKTQTETQNQRHPQAVLWQLRNLHTPKRKTNKNNKNRFARDNLLGVMGI
jgi:hypothetical protein